MDHMKIIILQKRSLFCVDFKKKKKKKKKKKVKFPF